MPQSHSDHGVAGQRHWLLDEELSSASKGRLARPAALAREQLSRAPVLVIAATPTLPPRRNFVLLLAGVVAALLVYALLSSAAVVGALDEVFANDEAGAVRITATFDEPSARELSELRLLLARTPAVTTGEQGATSASTKAEKPRSPTPPQADDGVLPTLPPPPAPPPLVPEVELPPVEAPSVEVPPLPALEVPELPLLPELPELL